MAWIESHTVLIRHRKLKELSLALNIKPVYVLGHLHALWHTALEQQEDGDLSRWSDQLIAEAAAYEGNANIFVEHLKNLNWIEKNGLIHDWLDYAWKYLSSKYRTGNPQKLKEIEKKHKTAFRQTKVRQKTAHLPNLPTLPNQDNLPTITDDGFEKFWNEYPKKTGKKKAFQSWRSESPSKELQDKILKAVIDQKKWPQWNRDDGQYIPNPATWINQGRWDDAYEDRRCKKCNDRGKYTSKTGYEIVCDCLAGKGKS